MPRRAIAVAFAHALSPCRNRVKHHADQPPEPRDQGDAHEASLRALVDALRPDLLRRIGALCERDHDVHAATADLAAESMQRFLATVRSRDLRGMSRGEAWGLLSTIAHHVVVDSVRRQQVRSLALARLRAELEVESPELEPAVAVELRELVDRAMGAMTPDERAIVSRRLGGASWADIARETEVGEEVLRQRWTALRRRLRDLMGGA